MTRRLRVIETGPDTVASLDPTTHDFLAHLAQNPATFEQLLELARCARAWRVEWPRTTGRYCTMTRYDGRGGNRAVGQVLRAVVDGTWRALFFGNHLDEVEYPTAADAMDAVDKHLREYGWTLVGTSGVGAVPS